MVKIIKINNYKKKIIIKTIVIVIIIVITIVLLQYIFTKYSFIELFNENNESTENTKSNNNIIKQDSAVFLGHTGLGDNITYIGALHFLMNYYNTIHFLCKDIYIENLNLLFKNNIINKTIVLVPINSNNELEDCKTKISEFMQNNLTDIFISGFMFTSHLKSRITHPNLLSYVQNDNGYTIEYIHIRDFYYDIGLDLSIYYNYFNIDSFKESKEYFDAVKNYNIIFLHTKSSARELSLTNIIDKYINISDAIIICANKNVYDITYNKYELANKYVNLLVPYYIDIICNALEIHIVDSCFSCIVYPLNITKKLKASFVKIYGRNDNI